MALFRRPWSPRARRAAEPVDPRVQWPLVYLRGRLGLEVLALRVSEDRQVLWGDFAGEDERRLRISWMPRLGQLSVTEDDELVGVYPDFAELVVALSELDATA